jgi:AcrR family transcriptional regulator
VRAVMRATLDELARAGYARLRVEDVSKRASVNKTSIYRRWPTKVALVDAAIRSVGFTQAIPDSGLVRSDLVEMIRHAAAVTSAPDGRVIIRLLSTEISDPDIERITHSLKTELLSRRVEVVDRAKQRGELPADVDARLIVDAIVAPIMTRILRDTEPVDDDTIVRLVDIVLTGVVNGGGRRVA